MANATSTQLQELYVAYFGRAADPTGLDYWTEAGITAASFAANMYAQEEFKSEYGTKSTEAQVNQIYKNLFDREADVAGLTYWTQQINLGVLKVAEIANDLIWAAQNNSGSSDDKTALTNRTAAAVAYTAKVKESTANILAYQPSSTSPFTAGVNITEAKTYLSGIDKDTAHTADGITESIGKFTAGSVETAKTFNLTTGVDNITGGSGNDLINAYIAYTAGGVVTNTNVTTYTAADVINGGDGVDTFELVLDTAPAGAVVAPALTATNLENVSLKNVSGQQATLSVANVGGLTGVTNNMSTANVVINAIGSGDVTIVGNDVVTHGNTTFNSAAAGATATTDALVINLKGGVGAGNIVSSTNADDWTAVTINSTGGTAVSGTSEANQVGAITLGGGTLVQTLTIDADSSFRATGAITGWDAATAGVLNTGVITVKGDSLVDIDDNALNAAVETVNASASTGGVRVAASSQTDFQFVGSEAADRFTTGAVGSTLSGSALSVDANGGTDRLIVGTTGHITAAIGELYTDFEELQVNNGVTTNLTQLDHNTISSVRINDAAGATGLTNLTATQAANLKVVAGNATGAITIGVANAATVGNIDTVVLTADDEAAAVGTIALGTPVIAGVENLTINGTDIVTIAALTGAAQVTNLKLNQTHATGTSTVVTGAVAFGVNTHLDASGSTAAVSINANASTSGNAIRVTGGSGDDTLRTSGRTTMADIVQGGLGRDTITITSDAGTAEIVTVISEATKTEDGDIITGFESAEDQFDFNGTLSNGSGSGAVSTAEVTSAATFAAGLAAGTGANSTVFLTTTNMTATQGLTALDACVTGGMTDAEAQAFEDTLIGTGGLLAGAIANLDSVLGSSDVVLLEVESAISSAVLRIANTDTSTANTLTNAEIDLVAVFAATATLAAADFA